MKKINENKKAIMTEKAQSEYHHSPITAIAVFSITPIDRILLVLVNEVGNYETRNYTLIKVGHYGGGSYRIGGWHEYRVCEKDFRKWKQSGFDKLKSMWWLRKPDRNEGDDLHFIKHSLHCVNFNQDDRHGYFRETLKYREGYSIKEGGNIFVQFLCEAQFIPQNYLDLPDQARNDIFHWLLVCKRLDLQEIKQVICMYIVKMY